MTESTYRCLCGEITGERCAAERVEAADLRAVEHMPEHLRASHEAAGTAGVYPHNGAVRLALHRECAERLADGEWTCIVERDPVRYADRASESYDVTIDDNGQRVTLTVEAASPRAAMIEALTDSDDWSDDDERVRAWCGGETMTRDAALRASEEDV